MTDRLISPWVLTHCWLQTCVYQTSKFSNEEAGSSTLRRALHPLVHITSWPKPPATWVLVCSLLLSEAAFWICLHVGAVWLTSGSLVWSSVFSDPQGSSVLNFKIVSNHRPLSQRAEHAMDFPSCWLDPVEEVIQSHGNQQLTLSFLRTVYLTVGRIVSLFSWKLLYLALDEISASPTPHSRATVLELWRWGWGWGSRVLLSHISFQEVLFATFLVS